MMAALDVAADVVRLALHRGRTPAGAREDALQPS